MFDQDMPSALGSLSSSSPSSDECQAKRGGTAGLSSSVQRDNA
ncbi:hypothetical protein Psta_1099 [Pirellula staleyi DSM 6068]|uniref:Uncharacterized protein n=1 Tax=Pirellula staleyi (strain ATCC 27377 / DSM 6068 / ICPB 4128) TaxID=530564 RepID=D2R8G5_PIRSD|nr:hypothetical protein Psta_1099 [Pirellula staleyi DSM 6068]